MDDIPLIVKIIALIGKLVLAAFWGTYGTVLACLLFLQLGPRKFFKRVQRPVPPTAATDPVYGKHSMITLKVIVFLQYNIY